jgi:flagellar motor switch/type III secretory pathway protein FliN
VNTQQQKATNKQINDSKWTVPAALAGWPQGQLFYSESDAKYLMHDSVGNRAAALHWIGPAPKDQTSSVWSLEVQGANGGYHAAWCICIDWPVTHDCRPVGQRWYAGTFPANSGAINIACWPEHESPPAWQQQPLPPPPPMTQPPPAQEYFQRFEQILTRQGAAVSDMVAGLQAKLEGAASFSEQRYAALEANLEEQTKLREDRARVTETYMHELAEYQTSTTIERMTEQIGQHGAQVEARCASTESYVTQLRELTEGSVAEQVEHMTASVEARLGDTTTILEAHVDKRLDDATSTLQAKLDQRLDEVRSAICETMQRGLLVDMWVLSDVYKNVSLSLENGRLQTALCDAVVKRPLPGDGDSPAGADPKRHCVVANEEVAPWHFGREDRKDNGSVVLGVAMT